MLERKKSFDFGKREVLEGSKFFIKLAILSLILVFFGYLVQKPLEFLVSYLVSGLLNLGSYYYSIVYVGTTGFPYLEIIRGEEKISVLISFLCTGWFEFSVLSSAIFFSKAKLRKRFLGIFFALVGTFVINVLRIWSIILLIFNSSAGLVVLAHDFGFRLTIFLVIVLGYWAWLEIACR
jgi:exosortase/archaeosortase family protein